MRALHRKLGPSKEAVCAAYAAAERDGQVERKRNKYALTPEQYAARLWADVQRRGGFD